MNTYKTVEWFINGVLVNISRKFSDSYCTIKNGTPSNIRDKVKTTYSSNWQSDGINKLFEKGIKPKDSYHDTTWGYTGSMTNKKDIQSLIEINK